MPLRAERRIQVDSRCVRPFPSHACPRERVLGRLMSCKAVRQRPSDLTNWDHFIQANILPSSRKYIHQNCFDFHGRVVFEPVDSNQNMNGTPFNVGYFMVFLVAGGSWGVGWQKYWCWFMSRDIMNFSVVKHFCKYCSSGSYPARQVMRQSVSKRNRCNRIKLGADAFKWRNQVEEIQPNTWRGSKALVCIYLALTNPGSTVSPNHSGQEIKS